MDATASIPECRSRLAELIKERALQFGEFTLASGQKSSYYIDGKQVTLDAEGVYCLARCILDMIQDTDIEAAGGMTLGADPIAGAVAAVAGSLGKKLSAFLVRKEQKERGTRQQVEGPVGEGVKVAVLEDVVTTAGSTLKAIEALKREKQAQVVKVIAMVDRLQGGRENLAREGYELEAIFTIEELGVTV